MSIILSNKSEEYLRKSITSNFIVDIMFIEEACTQIYNPTIEYIKDVDLENYKDYEKVSNENLILYLSDWFIKIYGKLEEYHLDVGGFFKKKLTITNIDPIIKNTCRIDK
ncbi:MAG: hypothetical protein ACFFCE_02160 [Promethearchaeota archaeon]